MQNFTFDELLEFTRNEEKMIEDVMPPSIAEHEMEPSDHSVRLIIQYAKSLSVRNTKSMGQIRILLN